MNRKEGNVSFNDALNTFYLRLYGVGVCMDRGIWTEIDGWMNGEANRQTHRQDEGRKEMFYLTTHSTHYIYGYMASNIW